ncbi:NAD(P)H-binding protein [Streptomyces kanamyceticus]|uniref:NAD-dependent epimerase/dehydratase family protein n=1 Tax=Streptomyces kanamyceticus TaxID=1967 RepID=A0A5J6GPB4_STRKN|nr:NAD(P)H-binding protein [Streptomyces kanamyceticus]QEU96262.1 NAD-dependent epimerase/dehydratase family protein [Streptomyces kanamyceticus]
MTILITGATGSVGRYVVDLLVTAGAPVRALTRTPDAAGLPPGTEVFEGDLLRPDSLVPALAGVERLYLFPEPATAHEVVDRAKRAGVAHIVVLSSDAVTEGSDPDHHRPVEEAVEASGLAWTHVRPGEFAANKLSLWHRSIRAEGVVRSAYPTAVGAPVHEADVAAVAAAALLEDGHAGAVHRVSGPSALAVRDQVAALARGLDRALRLVEVGHDEARADMLRDGFPESVADYILAHQARWVDRPAPVHDTVRRLTGRPAHDLARWGADHRQDFR